jgi:hypothetical protein
MGGRRMFERLDVSRLKKKHRVDEVSIEEGRRDLPASSDRTLDAHQSAIVHDVGEHINRCKTLAVTELQRGHGKLSELDARIRARPFTQECSDIQARFDSHLSSLEAERRNPLERLRVAERRLMRDLNYFRAANQLNREAHYPDSRILHWAIIIGMIVFESLANAYFFAEGSALGFAGGWLQSIVVSLLVILASAKLIGARAVPLLNHVSGKWMAIGAVLLALYIVLLVAFALLVAHYRLLLTIDPDNALVKTLPHYLAAPFDLDPVSWTFFGVSIVFGLSALIAGYTSDDRYPGYGDLDRRHKSAERAYDLQKDAFSKDLRDAYETATAAVASLVTEAQTMTHQRQVLVPEMRTVHSEYLSLVENCVRTCNTVLRAYRDLNKQVRTAASPSYFEVEHSFGAEVHDGLPDIRVMAQDSAYEEVHKKLLEKAGEVRRHLQRALEARQSGLPSYFGSIDGAAARTVAEDARVGSR